MTKYIAIAVLSLALLIPATSNASRYDFGDSRSGALIPGKVYLGVQMGQLSIEADTSGSEPVEMDHVGFSFGGDINQYLGLEFAYSQTVSDEREGVERGSTDTMGLFLVGRTQDDVYFKGRAGYTIVNQDFDLVATSINDNVYGLAYGVGAGIKFGRTIALEIEYTIFPETDEFDALGSAFGVDFDTEFVTLGLVWAIE
ncbi:MAG: porin family protein [Gammaproteobacteria bacterium]|nr:porin family protein [Gammaproteobacteria bacterium]